MEGPAEDEEPVREEEEEEEEEAEDDREAQPGEEGAAPGSEKKRVEKAPKTIVQRLALQEFYDSASCEPMALAWCHCRWAACACGR